ncbi:MAG TPA: GGDEF domain-containing protein [Candidatus Angelobacter sp.]|nr:GGDEF domain-containing protein [Candidatus Angelobacter sp.]
MEPSTKQQSLLATVSEQLIALEKRDWEVWLLSAGVGMMIGVGILVLLFRAAFVQHGSLRLNVAVSPVFFFGFVAILVLFNVYVIGRRVQLRRTRQQLISTTIQSELVRLQSFTDPLTEVYNRRALDDIARRFMSNANRQGKPLTFMMLDVDQFKTINTRFGHLIGDFVLAEVATILRGAVRGSDAVVRYGGDEFLVILYNSTFQGGQVVVNRMAGSLEDWNREEHLKNFELSFSIGIAEWSDGKLLDEMLDSADQAMYSTKALHKLARTNPSEASAPELSNRARTLADD